MPTDSAEDSLTTTTATTTTAISSAKPLLAEPGAELLAQVASPKAASGPTAASGPPAVSGPTAASAPIAASGSTTVSGDTDINIEQPTTLSLIPTTEAGTSLVDSASMATQSGSSVLPELEVTPSILSSSDISTTSMIIQATDTTTVAPIVQPVPTVDQPVVEESKEQNKTAVTLSAMREITSKLPNQESGETVTSIQSSQESALCVQAARSIVEQQPYVLMSPATSVAGHIDPVADSSAGLVTLIPLYASPTKLTQQSAVFDSVQQSNEATALQCSAATQLLPATFGSGTAAAETTSQQSTAVAAARASGAVGSSAIPNFSQTTTHTSLNIQSLPPASFSSDVQPQTVPEQHGPGNLKFTSSGVHPQEQGNLIYNVSTPSGAQPTCSAAPESASHQQVQTCSSAMQPASNSFQQTPQQNVTFQKTAQQFQNVSFQGAGSNSAQTFTYQAGTHAAQNNVTYQQISESSDPSPSYQQQNQATSGQPGSNSVYQCSGGQQQTISYQGMLCQPTVSYQGGSGQPTITFQTNSGQPMTFQGIGSQTGNSYQGHSGLQYQGQPGQSNVSYQGQGGQSNISYQGPGGQSAISYQGGNGVSYQAGCGQPQQQQFQGGIEAQQQQTVQFGAATVMTQANEQQTIHMQGILGQQTIQNLVTTVQGHGATVFNSAAAQLICTQPHPGDTGGAGAIHAQTDAVAVACQQYLASTAAAVQGGSMIAMPQMQVIQAAPNQFLQQQCMPHQFMFQNMAIPFQAIQTHQLGQAQLLGQQQQQQQQPQQQQQQMVRPVGMVGPKSPTSQPGTPRPSSQSTSPMTPRVSMTQEGFTAMQAVTQANVSRGMATVLPQQQQQATASMFAARQMMQRQMSSGPLVIGQIGMMPTGQQQTAVQLGGMQQQQAQQQQQVRAGAMSGAINLGALNGAQLFTGPNGTQQIRFATAPNYITNTGQFIGTNQALVNMGQFQGMPIMQSMMPNQGTTILGSQPLYIQTTPDNMQQQAQQQLQQQLQQQQPMGIISNVQAVAPIKNIANIAPQSAQRTQSSQPAARRGANTSINAPGTPNHNTSRQSGASAQRSSPKVRPLVKTPPSASSIGQPPKPITVSAAATTSNSVPQSAAMPVAHTTTATATVGKLPTVAVSPSLHQATATPTTTERASRTENTHTSVSHLKVPETPLVVTKLSPDSSRQAAAISSPVSLPASSVVNTAVCPVKHENSAETGGGASGASTVANRKVCSVRSSSSSTGKTKPGKQDSSGEVVKAAKKSRPKILTHIIEGFIIQEAPEPFPVDRTSLMTQFLSPNIPLPDNSGGALGGQTYKGTRMTGVMEDDDDDDDDDDEEVGSQGGGESEMKTGGSCHLVDNISKSIMEAQSIIKQDESATYVPPNDGIERLKCEFCGNYEAITNFARSRRFCSVTCSKRYSAYSQRKNGGSMPPGSFSRPPGSSSRGAKRGGGANTPSVTGVQGQPTQKLSKTSPVCSVNTQTSSAIPPCSASSLLPQATTPVTTTSSSSSSSSKSTEVIAEVNAGVVSAASSLIVTGGSASSLPPPPTSLPELERFDRMDVDAEDGPPPSSRPLSQWGVHEVYEFVRRLPGCEIYADEFRSQEIDGQALMLLTEDHLMMTLNVKLGPALKICSRIKSLKD